MLFLAPYSTFLSTLPLAPQNVFSTSYFAYPRHNFWAGDLFFHIISIHEQPYFRPARKPKGRGKQLTIFFYFRFFSRRIVPVCHFSSGPKQSARNPERVNDLIQCVFIFQPTVSQLLIKKSEKNSRNATRNAKVGPITFRWLHNSFPLFFCSFFSCTPGRGGVKCRPGN